MSHEKKIKEILEDFTSKHDKLTMHAKLKDDLNMDSLDLIEVVMVLEDHFAIEIHDKAIEKFATVSDIVDHINVILVNKIRAEG